MVIAIKITGRTADLINRPADRTDRPTDRRNRPADWAPSLTPAVLAVEVRAANERGDGDGGDGHCDGPLSFAVRSQSAVLVITARHSIGGTIGKEAWRSFGSWK